MADGQGEAGAVRYAVAALLTGLVAGLGGAVLTFALGAVELLWFGRQHGPGPEAAVLAPAALRTTAVVVAGCVTAVGWWLVRRRGSPPSVTEAAAGARMRVLPSVSNALLQIVNVASGASIGREAAPREIGALGAERWSAVLGLSARQRQVLVAAGAGAGLAAIYDVPLSGVLFALEVVLAPAVADAVLPVAAAVATAVVVARLVGVPAGPLYHLRVEPWGPALVGLAVVLGPLLGAAGTAFAALVDRLAALARRRRWLVLVLLPLASAATAAVALGLPHVLGNGQALSLLALSGAGPIGLFALLALAKAFTTAATLGSGAAGGRLNPSFSMGAAAGAAAGGAVSLVVPGAPEASAALVGAGAFLAAAQRSPLTAVALAVEFTDSGARLLLPVLVAVAGSTAAERLLSHREETRRRRSRRRRPS